MKFVNFLIAGVFTFSFFPLSPALGQSRILSSQQAQMQLARQLGGSPNIPGTMYAQSGCQRSPSPSLTPIGEAQDTIRDEIKELEDEKKPINENKKKCDKGEPKKTKQNGETVPWCKKDGDKDSSSSSSSKGKSNQEKIKDLFHGEVIKILDAKAKNGRLKLEETTDCSGLSNDLDWWKEKFST